ncbi:transcriptional regulator [Pseudaminobacter salicylatoxidans]|nr:transcriptional regulator [Pseudaminobacter salicylatoxidans]
MKSEADRIRAQYAALTKHYRAIGPAAILAAVLAAKKRKPSANKPA